jgi:predicted  nucleic acid-binding Zn-ribbon protein
LLEMTGSGKELAKLLQNLSGEMENLEQKILPAIKKLKKLDKELEEMKSKLNRRQRRELKMKGYTTVDEGKKWEM